MLVNMVFLLRCMIVLRIDVAITDLDAQLQVFRKFFIIVMSWGVSLKFLH